MYILVIRLVFKYRHCYKLPLLLLRIGTVALSRPGAGCWPNMSLNPKIE